MSLAEILKETSALLIETSVMCADLLWGQPDARLVSERKFST
jgi:hypothetical protein